MAARAAGEAAGLDGSEDSMDLNVPGHDPAATNLIVEVDEPRAWCHGGVTTIGPWIGCHGPRTLPAPSSGQEIVS